METNRFRFKFKFDAEHIYVLSVVFALGLLFYANADAQETPNGFAVKLGIGKSFYMPCGIALITSFFVKKKRDRLDRVLDCLVCVAILSSLISFPVGNNPLTWTVTRFVMAILCFRNIRNIDPILLSKYAAIFAPLIVFPHYFITNPFSYGSYRYCGFYGDPNFLAIALNLLSVFCYISIKNENRLFLRFYYLSAIIGSIPLILLGMSRGGVLGMVIILIVMMIDLYKVSKWKFAVIVLLAVLTSGLFMSQFSNTLDLIESRFKNESSSDQGSTQGRIDSVNSAFNVLENKPGYIPLGIGLGNTYGRKYELQKLGYFCKYVVHCTYVSILLELGVVGLLMYLYFNFYSLKKLYQRRDFLILGLLFSTSLSLFTLPGSAFMPGWIVLFFVNTKNNN